MERADNLLNANTISFSDIISGDNVYHVPLFQRDYSWNEPNWDDLWLDISNARESNTRHYMGSIVLIRKDKKDLDGSIAAAKSLKMESHTSIKIQSLLNVTTYALATRFLEGSVKLIIYNCAIFRGDNTVSLSSLESSLKRINNPEFNNIRENFEQHLNFNIIQGKHDGRYSERDIVFLNQIVQNRHKNVHATHSPRDWYGTNLKDIINDFPKEYEGLLNILIYLDSIRYDHESGTFIAS
jgi:hypothetical protein